MSGPAGTGTGAEAIDGCVSTASCTRETWIRPGAASLSLLRSSTRMWREGSTERWLVEWRGLAGTLALCLGDPLATPPAADPGGFRLLHERGDRWRWSVHYSGANACGIAGHLELDATADRVDAHALLVDGMPWDRGGRERARERARAKARAEAEAAWAGASKADRVRILNALQQDPEAAALVEDLRSRP